MAAPSCGRDLHTVVVVVFLALGCALGAVVFALARDPLPLGLAGALVAGALGALMGATAESLLEGSRHFELDAASTVGAASGALLLVAMVARAGRSPLHRA